MCARFHRGGLAVILALAALLTYQPGTVQAHPQLVGRWVAQTPPGGLMVYQFSCAEYIGYGFWRGTYEFSMPDCTVLHGSYELRMFNGTQGTVAFSTNLSGMADVGIVDLGTKAVVIGNVEYHR